MDVTDIRTYSTCFCRTTCHVMPCPLAARCRWLFLCILLAMVFANLVLLDLQSDTGHTTHVGDSAVTDHITPVTDKNQLPDNSVISRWEAQHILNESSMKSLQFKHLTAGSQGHSSVMFLKTHKTASSTLQNILTRYSLSHNLSVALPVYGASFFYPAVLFHRTFVLNGDDRKFDFLLHHMVFAKEQVRKVMRNDAVYVTILRDPVELFMSAYNFYSYEKCFQSPLETIDLTKHTSLNVTKCLMTHGHVGNIQMFDLGMDLNRMKTDLDIHRAVARVDKTFDVVLITDMFAESLLVMKHKLNWTMSDIVYFTANQQRRSARQILPSNLTNDLYKFHHADNLLYRHFRAKILRDIDAIYPDRAVLQADLLELKRLNQVWYDYCVDARVPVAMISLKDRSKFRYFIGYGDVLSYRLRLQMQDDIVCRLLTLPELSINKYMKATTSNHWRPTTRKDLDMLMMKSLRRS